MDQQLINRHFIACRSATTPSELEAALAKARRDLTESEYIALQARLLTAMNEGAASAQAK